jgi:hypothetical protein
MDVLQDEVFEAAGAVGAVVRRFCMDERRARFGPFQRADGSREAPQASPLIEGRLYRVRLVDAERYPVEVQVYIGLEELGGLLWEQEMRVLLRIGTSDQNGMPKILGGGYLDEDDVRRAAPGSGLGGVGLVATRGSAYDLADPDALVYMREHPLVSLRQFTILAEALSMMHDLGISHRNLWPGTVNATDTDPVQLSLARFELSAMLENLLRGSSVDAEEDGAALRRLYRSQGARALAFAPSERWPFLFPGAGQFDLADLEDERTDVFSLGCIVWEWFLGPMNAEHMPRPEDDDATTVARLTELHSAMRSKLNVTASVPTVLRRILTGMLDADPRTRSTAAEVVEALSAGYERLVATWDGSESAEPYLLGFMPAESAPTVKEWDWIAHPPDSREGKEELRLLLEDDLRRGVLLESPDGAAPFIESRDDAKTKREARYVLLGRRGAWFCILFRKKGFGGRGLGPPMPQVLVVKYVVKRERPSTRAGLAFLSATGFRRQLPPIRAIPVDIAPDALSKEAANKPSWEPLLAAVHPVRPVPPGERRFRAAIEWLLEFQSVELRARTYPYTRVGGGGRVSEIELDAKRDRKWLAESTMLTRFAKVAGLRPPLGDFFGSLDEDSAEVEVEILPDDGGRPSRSFGSRIRATVYQQTGPDRIKIEVVPSGGHMPDQGWIRPADLGSRIALERQLVGRWDLLARPSLFAQLQKPMSFRLLPRRWQRAGAGLEGDGGKAVRDMLTFEPFFAVQGPPGTGKTTVAAEAVANYLRANPANRVLVSAQSNYALDNLATRILSRLDAIDVDGRPSGRWDGVALRVVSRSADVDENVRAWQWENLAERRFDEIRDRVREAAQVSAAAPERSVSRWLVRWNSTLDGGSAEEVLSELADRTRRAANLVFATCSMATAENVTSDGVRSAVDWVVVEEAAKAWPTELIIPMARGARWTLIGDHQQLSAHKRQDIERFLDSCLGDEEADLELEAASRADYLNVFDLFGSFFEEKSATTEDDAPALRPADAPLTTLRTQFRMRDAIAQVVSRCFYPTGDERFSDGLPAGRLRTGREVEPAYLDAPTWLAGTDLVWIDTGALAWCSDEPQWCNRGEAKIVSDLVDQLRPVHHPPWGASQECTLAVLSPYRRQNELLRGYGAVKGHLSTVHAFQGREADVVVVSLVRDTRRGVGDVPSPSASLGHLISPNLANVLLSRAKRLLILVGNYQHFATFDEGPGGFWGDVCRAVSLYGRRIPAEDHFREGR